MSKSRNANGFVDILVFLIPCLDFVQLKLVGKLSGSDILIILVFLFLLFRRQLRITTKAGKWLLILCSLWLVSQCVTDIVRRSAFSDYARGWSSIGITIACLAILWTFLYGQPRRIVIYAWGLVVGGFLTYLIIPDENMIKGPWKFGIARPLSLAVFLLLSRDKIRDHWPLIGGTCIGLLNIVMGARSLGGICLAATLLLYFTRTVLKRSKGVFRVESKTLIVLAVSIILSLSGLLWAYQYAASHGTLGEEAQNKYEIQSGGRFGLVLGGRMDVLGAAFAIYDSPILGHGSWAKDPKYLIAQLRTLALLDYDVEGDYSPELLDEGLIPAHSHILGAWVDAGILGALFWGWVLYMTLRRLFRVYPPSVPLRPLAFFLAFSLLWDLLFSPYGSVMRIITPYYIVAVLSCLNDSILVTDRSLEGELR